jgi:TPR repeat protein
LDIQEIRRQAEAGNAVNQCALGLCYLYGVEVPVDYVRAFGLLSGAAGKHVTRARLHLGFMYAEGWGTRRNVPEAIALFKLVAAEDDESDGFEACIALGRIYADAVPDLALALEWYAAAISVAPEGDGDDLREAKAYLARYRKEG